MIDTCDQKFHVLLNSIITPYPGLGKYMQNTIYDIHVYPVW